MAERVLRMSITLPGDLGDQLRAVSDTRRLPIASVVREYIALGIERQKLIKRLADAVEGAA